LVAYFDTATNLPITPNGGNGGSGIIIIRYRQIINMKGTPEMQLVIGNTIASGGSNYKIGNYNGDFQIKTSTSNVDTTSLIIQNTANVGIGTNVITSKLHLYDSASNAIFTIQDNTSLSTSIVPTTITAAVVSPATLSAITTTPSSFVKQLALAYTANSAGFTGQTSYTLTIPEDINVDILVVAGGGAGGFFGGGGGGGQVLLTTNYNIAAGTSIIVNVGNGGTGNNTAGINGQNGFNSSITIAGTSFTANGGGGGGSRSGTSPFNAIAGSSGGSGGGSSSGDVAPYAIGGVSVENTYTNWRSFGYNGGIGSFYPGTGNVNHYAGGGGGAGNIGGTGVYFNNTVATGGDGVNLTDIFGSTQGVGGWFGGGGGGINSGSTSTIPTGGAGGGGKGATSTPVAASENGTEKSGGGGGGSISSAGANGGSGVVIIRYRQRNREGNAEIQLIKGASVSAGYTNYKLGNYGGDFQIKSSLLGTDTNRLVIGSTGNIGIGTKNSINKLHLYEDIANNTKLIVQNNYILNIQPIVPTGASITTGLITTTVNSTDRYMIFTAGTSSFTVPPGGINCDILMIGGGGAGGFNRGGGGGAGACIVAINQTLTEGTYNAIVGDGDVASSADSGAGGDSIISFSGEGARYLARGGGRGQQNTANGIDGGCGGGGGWGSGATRGGGNPLNTNIVNGSAANIAPTGPVTIGLDYVVLGYKGGNQQDNTTTSSSQTGPGGGGIGGEGINHALNSQNGTAGGPGLNQVTINSQIYNFQSWFANGGAFGANSGYIGGGGGGFTSSLGTDSNTNVGGIGGGGRGLYNVGGKVAPISGTANTGSGGGAGQAWVGSSSGGSGIIIIRYRMPSTIIGSPSIELIKGTSGDTNVDYKIGNYQDSFKIVSSVSGTDTDRLVLNNNGNITLSGSVNASSYLLNNINILTNITDTSNYVLSTSNNLVNRIVEEVGRGSNYALSSSNNLVNRIVAEVGRVSSCFERVKIVYIQTGSLL
jgi:hypothetical protein